MTVPTRYHHYDVLHGHFRDSSVVIIAEGEYIVGKYDNLFAPRNRHDILQNALNSSASWSKDWELDPNSTKSDHLPIGNSLHFLTYTFPSHNPPNTQTLPTVSTTKDMGIVLNIRLSAANKAHKMLFYLKRSFTALTPPSIFLALYKTFIRPHLEYTFRRPIPSDDPMPRRRGTGKVSKACSEVRERASLCPV